jgi:hypothetical protein
LIQSQDRRNHSIRHVLSWPYWSKIFIVIAQIQAATRSLSGRDAEEDVAGDPGPWRLCFGYLSRHAGGLRTPTRKRQALKRKMATVKFFVSQLRVSS